MTKKYLVACMFVSSLLLGCRAQEKEQSVGASPKQSVGALPDYFKLPMTYPVWYCTDRKPLDPENVSKGFSNDPDEEGRQYYGKCQVHVPKTHKIGSLGSPWWERIITGQDAPLKIVDCNTMDVDLYWSDIKRKLTRLAEEERIALVFIHGFNVSFEEATLRAAQIGVDLKIPVTAYYSWPSRGEVTSYVADMTSIDRSEERITNFLINFAESAEAERVHIIAHSMGNRALMYSMQEIAMRAEEASKVPFGQIFLAAPDIDPDTFKQVAKAYKNIAERITLYASSKDSALELSGTIHKYPRAGYMPPVTIVEGIDTVTVSEIDASLLGHGYYSAAREILSDMHDLILNNTPPERRLGLVPAESADGSFWIIR